MREVTWELNWVVQEKAFVLYPLKFCVTTPPSTHSYSSTPHSHWPYVFHPQKGPWLTGSALVQYQHGLLAGDFLSHLLWVQVIHKKPPGKEYCSFPILTIRHCHLVDKDFTTEQSLKEINFTLFWGPHSTFTEPSYFFCQSLWSGTSQVLNIVRAILWQDPAMQFRLI